MIGFHRIIGTVIVLMMVHVAPLRAQISDGFVKLGVLTDMTGVYSDLTGKGSILATEMAVEDCLKAECASMSIEVVSADHQNKADIAVNIGREWIDRRGVDALVDMSNASIQLAIPTLLRDKNRVGLFQGGTARLTGDACEPDHIVQWMWDTYVQASGITKLTKPGVSWYLVTADYAFGKQLEVDAQTLITARGGAFAGSVRHAFPASDMSSQMLTAQGSGADFIALANAGNDTVLGVKTARDFGILTSGKQHLVAFLLTVRDVKSLGLEASQGTLLTEGFYWDLDDRTRAFSRRFEAKNGGMPSMIHAGIYSSVKHYLRAVAAVKTDDAKTVIREMRKLPIDNDVVRNARLREDGRMVHDYYVFRVKKPTESKDPWDLYALEATIPGDQAFRPMSAELCPKIGN